MGLKKYLLIIAILIITIFSALTYNQSVLKDKEIEKLEAQITILQKQFLDDKNRESSKIEKDTMMFLKEGSFDIELYSSYSKSTDENENIRIWKPAFGPICKLNTYAIENTGGVKVLEQEDEFLTRVSIEGVIPTWVLEESIESNSNSFTVKQMYVIDESVVTLTPEKNSVEVNRFHIGKAVKVIDSYKDWFYITAYQENDANEIYRGWIKSNALGYYNDLDKNIGIEVMIKEGFEPDWALEFFDGLWGKISEENEETYTILTYGASYFEIEKENVESFFIMEE